MLVYSFVRSNSQVLVYSFVRSNSQVLVLCQPTCGFIQPGLGYGLGDRGKNMMRLGICRSSRLFLRTRARCGCAWVYPRH